MWQGVDYLFVDEFSMVGSKMLVQVCSALCKAKEDKSAFGGINVIFAGNFAQLSPVGDSRLFSRINTRSASESAQKHVQGKLLWYSIDTVVSLHEVMRQEGAANADFVNLLGRLRCGTCTRDDYNLLNTRLLSKVRPSWTEECWTNAPMIVSENAVKDAVNDKAAHAFASRVGRSVHYYYASDSHRGEDIRDPALRDHLHGLTSGTTSQRLGWRVTFSSRDARYDYPKFRRPCRRC